MEAVKELLNWSCWKKRSDDSFDMELFRAVASMLLPNLKAVKELLMSRWYKPKPDGSFKRLCQLKKALEAVDKLLNWSRWKKKSDGSFDMELFRAVASMCCLKRLAKFGSCREIAELVLLEEGSRMIVLIWNYSVLL